MESKSDLEIIIDESLTNIDLNKFLEDHVTNVLSNNFNGSRFDDILGNLYYEKYWDTPDESILNDTYSKINNSVPVILHRSVGANNSSSSSVFERFSQKLFTYEFIIGSLTTLEGSIRPKKIRPVTIISSRIENIIKDNPFKMPNMQNIPFSYSSERTVFRDSGEKDESRFGGLDIYLLRMQINFNHV